MNWPPFCLLMILSYNDSAKFSFFTNSARFGYFSIYSVKSHSCPSFAAFRSTSLSPPHAGPVYISNSSPVANICVILSVSLPVVYSNSTRTPVSSKIFSATGLSSIFSAPLEPFQLCKTFNVIDPSAFVSSFLHADSPISTKTSKKGNANLHAFFILLPPRHHIFFIDKLLPFRKKVHPLIEPIITPFTKYFCKNGYKHKMGNVAIIKVAIRKDSGVVCDAFTNPVEVPISEALLAASANACDSFKRLFNKVCTGKSSLLVTK